MLQLTQRTRLMRRQLVRRRPLPVTINVRRHPIRVQARRAMQHTQQTKQTMRSRQVGRTRVFGLVGSVPLASMPRRLYASTQTVRNVRKIAPPIRSPRSPQTTRIRKPVVLPVVPPPPPPPVAPPPSIYQDIIQLTNDKRDLFDKTFVNALSRKNTMASGNRKSILRNTRVRSSKNWRVCRSQRHRQTSSCHGQRNWNPFLPCRCEKSAIYH